MRECGLLGSDSVIFRAAGIDGMPKTGAGEKVMYRIMICEDDPKLARLLRDYMDKYGFHPFVVQDFGWVLEEFHRCVPHLVLLDVICPGTTAFTGAGKSVRFPLVRSCSFPPGWGRWTRFWRWSTGLTIIS